MLLVSDLILTFCAGMFICFFFVLGFYLCFSSFEKNCYSVLGGCCAIILMLTCIYVDTARG